MTAGEMARNWTSLAGSIRDKWNRLSPSDIDHIEGDRERLAGVLQERYGFAKERAEWEIDRWESEGGSSREDSNAPQFPRGIYPTPKASSPSTISGDFGDRPGSTPQTVERGWGGGLLAVAAILILIGGFGGFFFLPLALIAVIGLVFVPFGTRMFQRGKSRPHEANPHE